MGGLFPMPSLHKQMATTFSIIIYWQFIVMVIYGCWLLYFHSSFPDPKLYRVLVNITGVVIVTQSQVYISWTVPLDVKESKRIRGFLISLIDLSRRGKTTRFVYRPKQITSTVSYMATDLNPCTEYKVFVAPISDHSIGLFTHGTKFSTQHRKKTIHIIYMCEYVCSCLYMCKHACTCIQIEWMKKNFPSIPEYSRICHCRINWWRFIVLLLFRIEYYCWRIHHRGSCRKWWLCWRGSAGWPGKKKWWYVAFHQLQDNSKLHCIDRFCTIDWQV